MYPLFYAFSLTFSYFFTNTHKIHQNCKVRVYKIGGKRQQTKTHQQHTQTGTAARWNTRRKEAHRAPTEKHTGSNKERRQKDTQKEHRRTQDEGRQAARKAKGQGTREDKTRERKRRREKEHRTTRRDTKKEDEKGGEETKTAGTVGVLTVCGG